MPILCAKSVGTRYPQLAASDQSGDAYSGKLSEHGKRPTLVPVIKKAPVRRAADTPETSVRPSSVRPSTARMAVTGE